MDKKTYSPSEIDRMRGALKSLIGEYENYTRDLGDGVCASGFRLTAKSREVIEERLNTVMLAGISPEELEAQAFRQRESRKKSPFQPFRDQSKAD